MKRVEHIGHRADPHGEFGATGAQVFSELAKRLVNERVVQRAELGRLEQLRFVDVEAQDGTPLRRLEERAMVANPQVAFEPDDVHGLDGASLGS